MERRRPRAPDRRRGGADQRPAGRAPGAGAGGQRSAPGDRGAPGRRAARGRGARRLRRPHGGALRILARAGRTPLDGPLLRVDGPAGAHPR
ncbi:MAG: polyketide synthase, partial [bacterium]